MANKETVNFNDIIKDINSTEIKTLRIQGKDYKFEFYKSIPMDKYKKMMSDILNMIFDFKKGQYLSHNTYFAVQYNIIKYYTNINTSNKARIFDLVSKTNIYDIISGNLEPDIYYIEKEVESAVDFVKQTIFKSSKWDKAAEYIEDFFKQLDNIAEQFKNVDGDDLAKALNNLANISNDDVKDMVLQKVKKDG